jgi:hypothetical protein
MAILNNSNAISSGGYDINNSLRFRSSASAYLNRTPVSAGNRRTMTFSAWVKRGTFPASRQVIFGAHPSDIAFMGFESDNTFFYDVQPAFGTRYRWKTTAVFRDPSAWYHIVFVIDTTNATAANRFKFYVNGVDTPFNVDIGATGYIPINTQTDFNSNVIHAIGSYASSINLLFDGYMAEVNFIDGQALTPSSFGETDTTTGSWKPKAYTGTYGTNGFYLKFSDIATTSGSNAGLGKDFSGNANYWTTNNISVTAGVTYDAMIDSPTLTSATVANYAVLNPLNKDTSITVTDGNIAASAAGTNIGVTGSIAISSGKWYWEMTQTAGGVATSNIIGITDATLAAKTAGLTTNSYGYGTGTTAYKWNAGTNTAYGVNWTNGDVIGVAFDADAGTLIFYKNGSSQGTAFTGISGTFYPAFGFQSGSAYAVNFGQRPFSYTPPTGFVRLNTFNLPDSTIKKGNTVMDATTFTGTGASQSVVNTAAFKPDLVWAKSRGSAQDNWLADSNRGANNILYSNLTNAETVGGGVISSFNSNGFGVTSVFTNAVAYVGWQWQAGQGTTSSNTNGTITSTVSVNATAGFSVVTYTGTGANATVGHGLGVAPKMVIVKCRSFAYGWNVWHTTLSGTQYLNLNTTGSVGTATDAWNSTIPNSTVFSLGTNLGLNESGKTYVAYCWAEIAGFSKFTSYTGNGSADGPFIFTNFQPKFVMIKKTDTAGNYWVIRDTTRNTYNTTDLNLYPNVSDAEASASSAYIDILSNGFKIRGVASDVNTSSATYIVMAFASNPFKNSNAR